MSSKVNNDFCVRFNKSNLRRFYQPLLVSLVIIVLSVNLSKSSHTKRYGRRLSVGDFSDPKTVEVKDNVSPTEIQGAPPMTEYNFPRPIDILALGGSMTWAGFLEDKFGTYPWLVGWPNYNHVDNLAIPEMGTPYSALCLESIIPDSDVKNYDVILLDFIDGEFEGFEWLLKRLRERFPEAVMIYVHLWPLRALIENADGLQPDTLGLNSKVVWSWIGPGTNFHKLHPQMCGGTRGAVRNYGGHFWHLQFPRSPKQAMDWFSDDWWHLSVEGHKTVAGGLWEVLSGMEKDVFKPKRLGSFGAGDQCYSSFADVRTGIENLAQIKKLSPENFFSDTWFFELDPTKDSEIIHVENTFFSSIPMVVAYMSNREADTLYSSVEFSIKDQPPVRINPNQFYTPKHLPKVKYALVGQATPGNNTLQAKAIVPQKVNFLIVGLFLNGDFENTKMISSVKEEVDADNSSVRHVVSFIMQADPRKSVYNVDYEIVDSVLNTSAQRLFPYWDIHIIASDDKSSQLLSSHSNLKVVDYRDAPFSHSLRRFKRAYIHQSRNDAEYEKFCMYRWIIIFEYFYYLQMSGVVVKHILAIDSDLAVLEDPFLIDHAVDWSNIQSYKIVSGGAIMWSLEGLQSYVDFLMSIYTSRENAVEMVTQVGIKFICNEDRSLMIPCFMEGESKVMWHVSDLVFYNAWIRLNSELRIFKSEFDCIVLHKLSFEKEYHFIRKGPEILLNNGSETARVCIVHFQGPNSKQFAIPFISFVYGESSEYLVTKNIH
mmetsp:Transcript_28831/g.41304  ORF Transcript_28831/g.41304 Transcript_28831/m.41304 type:complete len:768 (+) Transcript_28831:68-2371(+)